MPVSTSIIPTVGPAEGGLFSAVRVSDFSGLAVVFERRTHLAHFFIDIYSLLLPLGLLHIILALL